VAITRVRIRTIIYLRERGMLAASEVGCASGSEAPLTESRGTALVTGAGRGIGRAVALGLAADGWDLALFGRSGAALDDVRKSIENDGGRAQAISGDITVVAEIAEAVAQFETSLGPIEVLVNNAGVQRLSPATEVTESDWDDILDTNLKGAFFCAQAVGRAMISRGRGSIINVGSAAGILAVADRAAYASSKAGLAMMTKVLALEWAPHQVRVNAIAPTFVATDMGRLTLDGPGGQQIIDRIPLGRIASEADVVGAVRYLIDAGFVTGQVLGIDGGITL
jgi:NAD(P)-dependent dehydrogenase (short-subunit alcohol dehydrogenase family)